MPRNKNLKKPPHPKKDGGVSQLHSDIRSLNSSILIIGQKMKYVVRNEKILGRNLIVLNKKFKNLEERIEAGKVGDKSTGTEILAEAGARLESLDTKLIELQAELASFKNGLASEEQLQELKYVIDTIHPLDFVTLEQAKDLIDEKCSKAKKK